MSGKAVSLVLKAVVAILPIALFASNAGAATQKVLYNFGASSTDGEYPSSALIFDKSGNLYGTTTNGGAEDSSGGTVFELTPNGDGAWTETILHSFGNSNDGASPDFGLIFDASGDLWGTTNRGGSDNNYGTVFELKPAGGGRWTESVVFNFGGNNGANPSSGLISDKAGNFYGTTAYSISTGDLTGKVFEVDAAGNETVLLDFDSTNYGTYPGPGLVFDQAGNLYATTYNGGPDQDGTVFELTPAGGGVWTLTQPHIFGHRGDGSNPYCNLIFDAAGNLYGTTQDGGAHVYGTVFELTPDGNGTWGETILHSFHSDAKGGARPNAGLVADGKGNLYGTTVWGGAFDRGEVFMFTRNDKGVWTHTVLHDFGKGTDGSGPDANLVLDAAGNLHGTTEDGGTYGYGTVFEIIP